MRTRDKLIMMHKIVHNKAPTYLKEMFTFSNPDYNLRSNNNFKIQIPHARTDYYKNSFAFTGAKLWNKLPNMLKAEADLSKFKSKLNGLDISVLK